MIELPRRNNKIQSKRPRLGTFRQYIEAQTDEGDGNGDERDQTDEPVEDYGEQSARFFIRRLFKQKIAFDNIAAGFRRAETDCKTCR